MPVKTTTKCGGRKCRGRATSRGRSSLRSVTAASRTKSYGALRPPSTGARSRSISAPASANAAAPATHRPGPAPPTPTLQRSLLGQLARRHHGGPVDLVPLRGLPLQSPARSTPTRRSRTSDSATAACAASSCSRSDPTSQPASTPVRHTGSWLGLATRHVSRTQTQTRTAAPGLVRAAQTPGLAPTSATTPGPGRSTAATRRRPALRSAGRNDIRVPLRTGHSCLGARRSKAHVRG